MLLGLPDQKIWGKLFDALVGSWQIQPLIPSFAFWGGGLLIYSLTNELKSLEKFRQESIPEGIVGDVLIIVGACLLVAISSSLMEWFTVPLLRWFEGYNWPCCFNWLEDRKRKNLRKEFTKKEKEWQALYQKWEGGTSTPEERKKYAHLDAELADYPVNQDDFLPTRLGNILRAAEEYSHINYGLEITVVWERLFLILPQECQKKIEYARQTLNERIRLITWGRLFLVWFLLPVITQIIPNPEKKSISIIADIIIIAVAVAIILISLIVCRVAYEGSLTAARFYGNLIRSAFDLYRFKLYDDLHWPRPTSPETEDEHGRELTTYLFRHFASPNIRFSTIDIKPTEPRVEKFKPERFRYLLNASNATFYWQSQKQTELGGAINNVDTRLELERIMRRAIEALEELRLDTEFYDVVRNNQRLERKPDDAFLSEFIQQERNLMIQAGMDGSWRKMTTHYLDLLIQTLRDIRDKTSSLEPFISWSQLQDLESRTKRVSYLKSKLGEIKNELNLSAEELNQTTISPPHLQHIKSTLWRFCLFTGGITLIFIAHSTLVDSSERDFSRLSIVLGSILAADSLKFREEESSEARLSLIRWLTGLRDF
jgi:hypothetical protein